MTFIWFYVFIALIGIGLLLYFLNRTTLQLSRGTDMIVTIQLDGKYLLPLLSNKQHVVGMSKDNNHITTGWIIRNNTIESLFYRQFFWNITDDGISLDSQASPIQIKYLNTRKVRLYSLQDERELTVKDDQPFFSTDSDNIVSLEIKAI